MAWRTMSPETHTVAVLAELPGIYGFILQDIPQIGSVVIVENTTAATGRTVVTTAPNPGEVFVGFDTGQAYCIFNIADNGISFIVNYNGGGSANSIENLKRIINLDTTDDLPEGATNKYFTNPRVLATPLTGFVTGSNTPLTSADTVLTGFENLQSQLDNFSGGSGVPNYITNPDFETNTTDWSAYSDAAGTIPVDGTGGSPNITITRSTSSPLVGVASGLITKDAANRQGQGVSTPFIIDSAAKGTNIQISFDAIVVSGTFNAGTATTDSDLTVYIYDITNSVLIPVTNIRLFSNSTTLAQKFTGVFQASSSSVSYRLILHNGTTNAVAYVLKVDNFVVGRQEIIPGAIITPAVAYTPVFTGWGTPTGVNFRSNRNGDYLEGEGYFVAGTTTGVEGRITFGSDGASGNVVADSGYSVLSLIGDGGSDTNPWILTATVEAGNNYFTQSLTDGTHVALQKLNPNVYAASGQKYYFRYRVKIAGWGSTIPLVSSGDNGREVFAELFLSANSAISANAPVIYDQKINDSHNAYNISTGEYIVPVAGTYIITVNGNTTASSTNIILYKNNSAFKFFGYTYNAQVTSCSVVARCNVGDILTVNSQSAVTWYGSASLPYETNVSFERISGNAIAYALPNSVKYAILENQQSSGTGGGALGAANTWIKSALVEASDPDNLVTISSNVVTISNAGIYRFRGFGTLYQLVGKIKWINTSDSIEYLGSPVFDSGAENLQSFFESNLVTIAAGKTFELQAIASSNNSANDLGRGAGNGTEIFSRVIIEKIA